MAIKRIDTNKLMSKAVVHGDTVYLSGLTASDTSLDVQGQCQQILDKIDQYLGEAGTDKSKILSAEIWADRYRHLGGYERNLGQVDRPRQPAGARHGRGQAGQPEAEHRDHGDRGALDRLQRCMRFGRQFDTDCVAPAAPRRRSTPRSSPRPCGPACRPRRAGRVAFISPGISRSSWRHGLRSPVTSITAASPRC